MKALSFFLLFFFVTSSLFSQWDPDAGIIEPYTENASIEADGKNKKAINDNDFETKWESSNPLPQHYIDDRKQNVFLEYAGDIEHNRNATQAAIDGNLESHINIKNSPVRFTFPKLLDLSMISVKAKGDQNIRILAKDGKGRVRETLTYKADESYRVKKFRTDSRNIKTLELQSEGSFTLFEVAALIGQPHIELIVDLGRKQPVGWIDTRHFAGKYVESVSLHISEDKQQWQKVADLNPEALNMVTTRFRERKVRYIKVLYHLTFDDYAKAYLWELRAYNRFGPYGPMPVFTESQKPLKNIVGVNTFWGWGMEKHAANLPADTGPEQFDDFMRHVRYYHNLDWDVVDPDTTPDYSSMPGSLKQKWLDWDREYKPVWDKGFSIQTTLQIPESFSPEVWDTPVESAYNYGKAFGQYFGSKNPILVEAAEIGNEPWKYGPQFYKKIFNGMSRGLKETAPRMTVLPCALSANKQRPHLDNYAGDWLNAGMKERIDALNIHLYSFTNNDRGEAMAVQPEHPESQMRGILNMLKFRNSNMPGTPVHITEWGWDASSEAMDCTHNECVTEEAQAAYAIRGLLMFYRLGVEKVFWFFFSDEDKPSHRFTRSGMLTSPQNGLKPKKSWHAVKSLILEVGDKFLYDISENNSGAWIYHFKDSSETPSHVVLWLPEKHRPQLKKEITFTTRRKIKRAFLPNAVERPISYTLKGGNRYSIKVGTYPVIVELE